MSSGVLELLWRRKYYRIDKATRELQFIPTQSLEAAVAETWTWLARSQGALHVG